MRKRGNRLYKDETILRADIKYLSIGLFIGISATGLLLTGMLIPPTVAANLPTRTATSAPTTQTPIPQTTATAHLPISTYTPTPTFIYRANPNANFNRNAHPHTNSPVPHSSLFQHPEGLLQDGYMSQVGPFDLRIQIRVYETSLKYVRTNTEESRLISEQINGQGYGAPSDFCGPLSIATLQEAGLINPDLDPHDFWLLTPDIWDDRHLLSKAFPPDRFENIRF